VPGATQSSAGLNLGHGLELGDGVWVDGHGTRTSVPARVHGSAIVFEVPGEIVERSVFPAVLDPIVSAEVVIPGRPDGGTVGNDQIEFSVAASTTQYLVAWQDSRNGLSEIWATRVSAAGVPLDPGALQVAVGPAFRDLPRVASDGTNFLIVWRDDSAPAAARAGRLTAAGVLLDGPGLPLSSMGVAEMPDVTFDGTNYIVTWVESPTSLTDSTVRLARVTPMGVRLDGDGVSIAAGGNVRRFHPRVTARPGDGVCCLTAGPGGTSDCQACSSAAGATGDGLCKPIAATVRCRPATSECDAEEFCSGSSTLCPADGVLATGVQCSIGACVSGVCNPSVSPDAGRPDAGLGGPDASVIDGGPSNDGGSSTDGGGSTDGGVSDDGGTSDDGGHSTDGGPSPDGGDTTSLDGGAGRGRLLVGCGCQSGSTDGAWVVIGGLGVAMLLRARQRRA
jgi:MYXO-CTERM domain-containing protein